MDGSILNQLGFDPAYLVFASVGITVALLIFCIGCLVQMRKLRRRYEKFMKGKNAENLEECISAMSDDLKALKGEDQANKEAIKAINRNLQRTFQSVGLVKYNAFPGMGGEASFALTLLDKEQNGFIMNNIHSREGSYLYIKEVVCGEPKILLGKEEEKSLKMAKNGK